MSRFFVVLAALSVASAAQIQKLSMAAKEAESHQSSSNFAFMGFSGDQPSYGGKKYSSSAELTSLAQSSALQAKSAVRNQQSAGLQAAVGAQSGYARAAAEAAAAAQVAFVAKQVIVQNLQAQIEDATTQLKAEEAQYHQALAAASAAHNAATQSQQQLSAATAAIAAVQQAVTQSERAATAASQAASTQHQMIEDAQHRLARLQDQFHDALSGLEETRASAHRAQAAAQLAEGNAAASVELAVANRATNDINERAEHYYRNY